MSVSINHPKDGVAEIIIDRDDKRNALNSETVKGITDAAIQLAKDDDLRVVVLRATGTRAFSAGADISELSGLDKTTAFNFINNLRGAIQAIFDLPVPVICRIQGACIGGAMEMAAGAVDLQIGIFSEDEALCGYISRQDLRYGGLPGTRPCCLRREEGGQDSQ